MGVWCARVGIGVCGLRVCCVGEAGVWGVLVGGFWVGWGVGLLVWWGGFGWCVCELWWSGV